MRPGNEVDKVDANQVNQIVRSIKNKRPQLIGLLFSFVMLLLTVVLMGGVGRLVLPVIGTGLVTLVPLFILHLVLSRRMLRPVTLMISSDAEQAYSRDDVRRCLSTLDAIPFKDALISVILWQVGIWTIIGLVSWRWGMTAWQVVVLGCLGLAGALVDALLAYHLNQRTLVPVRSLVEQRMPEGSALPEQTGHLSRRLIISFGLLMLLSLVMTSLVWLSNARSSVGEGILQAQRSAVRGVANRLRRSLTETPGGSLEKKLRAADPLGRLAPNLVIIGTDAQHLAGRAKVDPIWLKRISSEGAKDWLQMRAPFFYLVQELPGNRKLIWVDEQTGNWDSLVRTQIMGLGAIGLMLLMGLVLASSVVRTSLQPLRSLTEHVKRRASGDMSQSLTISGSGEVAALGRALEEFTGSTLRKIEQGRLSSAGLGEHHRRLTDRLENLRQGLDQRTQIAERTATSVVEMRSSIQSISEQVDSLRQASGDCSATLFEIEQSVREVAGSTDSLHELVDDSVSSIGEITRSMSEVSSSVDELARRAEDADSSVASMGLAIQQVEDHTSETHRLADELTEIASRGANSVRETISGINDIQLVTDEAREVINRLGAQMDSVGRILTVISDVAQQTNLLALNAAIIAAAAGEHGKGFAVVADEIKDLADRTATSTKEISGLIKSVHADSRRAVDAIERGSGSVSHGVLLANNAGDALEQIQGAVGQVSKMANEIHRSTREHGDRASSISKSMAEMSGVVREIRRAMSEQTKGGDRINQVSEKLREDALFLGRSTAEQVQAVAGVSQTMERISEMVGFVAKAISEQSQGVGHVAKVAEEVRDETMKDTMKLADVEEIAERIGRVAREAAEALPAGGTKDGSLSARDGGHEQAQ